jgi:hypothetical protein
MDLLLYRVIQEEISIFLGAQRIGHGIKKKRSSCEHVSNSE